MASRGIPVNWLNELSCAGTCCEPAGRRKHHLSLISPPPPPRANCPPAHYFADVQYGPFVGGSSPLPPPLVPMGSSHTLNTRDEKRRGGKWESLLPPPPLPNGTGRKGNLVPRWGSTQPALVSRRFLHGFFLASRGKCAPYERKLELLLNADRLGEEALGVWARQRKDSKIGSEFVRGLARKQL